MTAADSQNITQRGYWRSWDCRLEDLCDRRCTSFCEHQDEQDDPSRQRSNPLRRHASRSWVSLAILWLCSRNRLKDSSERFNVGNGFTRRLSQGSRRDRFLGSPSYLSCLLLTPRPSLGFAASPTRISTTSSDRRKFLTSVSTLPIFPSSALAEVEVPAPFPPKDAW